MLLGLSAAATAASILFPFRIDASGLMELSGGTEPWKGASGEALLRVIRIAWPLSVRDIIHVTRAMFVPTCAVAVLAGTATESNRTTWTWRGLDLNQALVVALLLVSPCFFFGALGVFNFWFFCLVMLALLLGWEDLSRAPGWASRLCLLSSVVLIGFARPETIAGGMVTAVLVVAFALRKRDWKLLALAVVVALALGAVAPTVVAYLGDRMRNQPLLTGSDATGDASTWMLPWIAFRRIALHAPLNVAVLSIVFNGMGVLAAARVVRMVRERRVAWPEVAALSLIFAEFLAIGVHREGFVRYTKYGQLLVVPIWYLAARAWYGLPVLRKARGWLAGSLAAGLAVSAASMLISWLGYTRCSLPEGRTYSARARDETLLWETAPRWAKSLCASGQDDDDHVPVVVVGLDERVQQEGEATVDMFSPPRCEPERSPLSHLLNREGCWAVAAYPAADQSVEEALFDPSRGALCGPVPFREFSPDPQSPAFAIVSFYRSERLDEIKAAVEHGSTCRWGMVEITESAVLLRRRELGR